MNQESPPKPTQRLLKGKPFEPPMAMKAVEQFGIVPEEYQWP